MNQTSDDALVDLPAVLAWYPELGESTVRVWAHRGRVRQWGRDRHGRPLYRWGDLKPLILAARHDGENGKDA